MNGKPGHATGRTEPGWVSPPGPIRIGISSCLLGHDVRWDGGHAHDSYITGTLGDHFTFVPVCPEASIGLGVPREPIRLSGGDPDHPRAVGVKRPELDVTAELQAFGRRMAGELGGISGYLFKSASPSCGMERVKVYRPQGGMPVKQGTGLYAREIMAANPLLPVEDEGRLCDAGLRDNFIERVFAYRRWQALLEEGLTAGRLVAFHDRHKLSLMAHGPEPARQLGRLVAEAGKRSRTELARAYGAAFMALLGRRATRRSHTNVLQHALGYFRKLLERDDRAELAETIEAYRRGHVPLIVPVTLFKHHLRRRPVPYLAGQIYLDPYPAELALRSSV